jgi:hypothetical protein
MAMFETMASIDEFVGETLVPSFGWPTSTKKFSDTIMGSSELYGTSTA